TDLPRKGPFDRRAAQLPGAEGTGGREPDGRAGLGETDMLHVLIVDADPAAAGVLAAAMGEREGYLVVGRAGDLRSAIELARNSNVHIAFIDAQLACFDSAYRIADELNGLGIECVFVTATEPPFLMPELAVAWLEK